MLRRVGLIGDVHAEDVALEQALASLQAETLDAILCVGDIADGHGDLDRTCALLEEANVLCVAGNHERWALTETHRALPNAHKLGTQARIFLAGLPSTHAFETPAGGALLCHGVDDDDMALLKSDTRGYALQALPLRPLQEREGLSFMLCGHSHEFMVREFAGLTVVNAGTLHREFEPAFVIVDFEKREVFRHLLGGERDRVPLPVPSAG